MTQPIAEGTEYVTQKSVDRLLQTLIDRIQESDEANRERIDALRRDVTAAIQQGKSETLAATHQLVDDRIAKEKAERRAEIDSFSSEFRRIDSRLDDMQKGMSETQKSTSETQKGVANITGLMESFRDVLKSRDEKDQETHKRLEGRIDAQQTTLAEARRDIDQITTSQASLTEKASRLQTTIHGDPNNKDDALSLFGKLNQIEQQVTQGFTQIGNRLDATAQQVGEVRADVATINRERADEKARWDQWRGTVKVGIKTFFGNKWVQWALMALAATVVITLFPELRESIAKLLLGEIQGG